MQTVGEILRDQRESYRQRLCDIAGMTNIREEYLQALEDDDYAALPSEPYVIGYIRCYARFVGLEEEALIKLYKQQAPQWPISSTPLSEQVLSKATIL